MCCTCGAPTVGIPATLVVLLSLTELPVATPQELLELVEPCGALGPVWTPAAPADGGWIPVPTDPPQAASAA
jgi:hypothetical protein